VANVNANAYYNNFKRGLLSQEFGFVTNDIRATLLDTATYTFNVSHSLYSSDVPNVEKVAVSPALTSKTITDGVFDTANFVWTAVTGDLSEAILLWSNTNGALIAYYDIGMTGMPIQPNGANINVTVNGSGWFTI
jgi:hypothetical protein